MTKNRIISLSLLKFPFSFGNNIYIYVRYYFRMKKKGLKLQIKATLAVCLSTASLSIVQRLGRLWTSTLDERQWLASRSVRFAIK
jgi:hypothetical protein